MRLLISISVLHWFYFHIFWTLEASDDAFEHGRIVSLPGRSTSESVNNVDVCPLLQSQGRPHVPDDLTTGWCNQHWLNCWVPTRTKVSLETCLDPLGTLHLLQQHSLSFPDWCPFSHAVSPSPIHCSIFSIVFIITRHIVCLHVCLCRSLFFAIVAYSLSRVQLFGDPRDCSPPGSSVHGISQAKILGWIAISFFRPSSQPRDQTHISCIAGGFLNTEPPGKPKV